MDKINKMNFRFDYYESLTGRTEKEIYFRNYIKPQFDNLIQYHIVKYRLIGDPDLCDVIQCVYVRLVLLMRNHNRYKINSYVNYVYTVIDKEFLAFIERRIKYRNTYILKDNIYG